MCASDIFRDDASWFMKFAINTAVGLLARTSEVGSRTILDAAKPNISDATHGAFLMDCKIFPYVERFCAFQRSSRC